MRTHGKLAMMLVLITAASMLSATAALAQTTYRYVDPSGRVVYSDRPPPSVAKDAQSRSLTANVIDTDALPFATRDAMKRYPVTLYTFDCDVCKSAEALLAQRGVPHTTVIVTDEKGAEKLKALTGGRSAPVLQVGGNEVAIGYSKSRWQSMLDHAGYPKNAPPLRAKAAIATSSPTTAASPSSSPAGAASGSAPKDRAEGSARAGPAPNSATPAPAQGTAAPAPASSGPGTGYPQ